MVGIRAPLHGSADPPPPPTAPGAPPASPAAARCRRPRPRAATRAPAAAGVRGHGGARARRLNCQAQVHTPAVSGTSAAHLAPAGAVHAGYVQHLHAARPLGARQHHRARAPPLRHARQRRRLRRQPWQGGLARRFESGSALAPVLSVLTTPANNTGSSPSGPQNRPPGQTVRSTRGSRAGHCRPRRRRPAHPRRRPPTRGAHPAWPRSKGSRPAGRQPCLRSLRRPLVRSGASAACLLGRLPPPNCSAGQLWS